MSFLFHMIIIPTCCEEFNISTATVMCNCFFFLFFFSENPSMMKNTQNPNSKYVSHWSDKTLSVCMFECKVLWPWDFYNHCIEICHFLFSPACFASYTLLVSYTDMINLWCSEAGSNNPLLMTNRAHHFGLSVRLLVFHMCGDGSFAASKIIVCKVRDCQEKPQKCDSSLSIPPISLSLTLTFHCTLYVCYSIPPLWNLLFKPTIAVFFFCLDYFWLSVPYWHCYISLSILFSPFYHILFYLIFYFSFYVTICDLMQIFSHSDHKRMQIKI